MQTMRSSNPTTSRCTVVSGRYDHDGVELDGELPPDLRSVSAFYHEAIYQKPKLSNVFIGTFLNGQTVNSAHSAQYDGNIQERTPQLMYSIQPRNDFPDHWGAVYLRYEYHRKIYADAGNAWPPRLRHTVGGRNVTSRQAQLT